MAKDFNAYAQSNSTKVDRSEIADRYLYFWLKKYYFRLLSEQYRVKSVNDLQRIAHRLNTLKALYISLKGDKQ